MAVCVCILFLKVHDEAQQLRELDSSRTEGVHLTKHCAYLVLHHSKSSALEYFLNIIFLVTIENYVCVVHIQINDLTSVSGRFTCTDVRPG